MPGFIISIGKNPLTFAPEKRKKLIVNSIESSRYRIERRVVDKFMDDRLFVDVSDYVIITEGVILNKKQLITKYASNGSFETCVKEMYRQLGDTFFKDFRGSFSGAFYDKGKDKWLIYTNHIGDKQVFYTKTPDGYLFGSEIGFLVDTLKQHQLPITVDETGVYMALTHGFCIEDRTLVSEVHKVIAGHYFELTSEGLREIQYHRFTNKPNNNLSLDDAVEGIDRLFRYAVQLQFEKDKDYGYRHLTCLSGGLDSRMTVWVAHEMGYVDQTHMTYSQSGYLDFSVAQQIAVDLHHDFLFKPLDGGDFIERYAFSPEITYGSGTLIGSGISLEKLINYDDFGLVHTGQLGDVILGTYLERPEYNRKHKISDGAYSQEIIERLQNYEFVNDYEDSEMFRIYNRGFEGIGQGLLTFQENTESCSPFTDVDFMEFCFSLPLNLRYGHKIYFDWILRKYPGAAEYVWEKTGKKIEAFTNKEYTHWNVAGYRIPSISNPEFPRWLKGSILRRLGLRKKGQKSKTVVFASPHGMSPIDYWYMTNPRLKSFMDSFWNDNKYIITDPKLFKDMEHLYNDCVTYEKMQCLSVLAAIKLIKS